MKNVLVTGGAGFIGSNLIRRLLKEGKWKIICLDNFDPFYDRKIKERNIALFLGEKNFRLAECDIRDAPALSKVFSSDYDVIVHLAAKAGVRPSISDPAGFQETNVKGTLNLLELSKDKTKQFIFGSSSSVYGVNPGVPWREDDRVLLPISPYASTKVAGELLGHVYHHLYGMRFIALRFFTVYGPGQRPDLAIHKFTKMMLAGEPIPVFGDGTTSRDYTYVDDIVQGVRAAMEYEGSGYEIINLGNHQTVTLEELIRVIEEGTGLKAIRQQLPEQPGDVPQTYADIGKAHRLLGYKPGTRLRDGFNEFLKWYNGLVVL